MEMLPDVASCTMLCLLWLGNLPFWQVELLFLAISGGKAESFLDSNIDLVVVPASGTRELLASRLRVE